MDADGCRWMQKKLAFSTVFDRLLPMKAYNLYSLAYVCFMASIVSGWINYPPFHLLAFVLSILTLGCFVGSYFLAWKENKPCKTQKTC